MQIPYKTSRLIITLPDTVDAHGYGCTRQLDYPARKIAYDVHPGDDEVPARWLVNKAREVVSLKRLETILAWAGVWPAAPHYDSTYELTPAVARLCCEIGDDRELCRLAQCASDDDDEIASGDDEIPETIFCADDAALILVAGVLKYERMQPDERPKRERRRRKAA